MAQLKYQVMLILVLLTLHCNCLYSQNFEIVDLQEIKSELLFTKPIWSPDAQQILVTTPGNNGLYIIDSETKKVKSLNEAKGIGHRAEWSKDGKNILFKEKKGFQQEEKIISVKDKSVKLIQAITPNNNGSARFSSNDDEIVVFINMQTLGIVAQNKITNESWPVTPHTGRYFNPLISPNGKKVAVNKGAIIQIYNTDGTGILSEVGQGLHTSWSPDSKYLLFFIDGGDGHSVTKSDLFVYGQEQESIQQLTYTTDKIEMWPNWSSQDRITYSDEKTGSIIIGTLRQN